MPTLTVQTPRSRRDGLLDVAFSTDGAVTAQELAAAPPVKYRWIVVSAVIAPSTASTTPIVSLLSGTTKILPPICMPGGLAFRGTSQSPWMEAQLEEALNITTDQPISGALQLKAVPAAR